MLLGYLTILGGGVDESKERSPHYVSNLTGGVD